MKRSLLAVIVTVLVAAMIFSVCVNAQDALIGDINGDDKVTSDDAVYLLMHVLFPEDYAITQIADYDGDGKTTSDDAVYLLRSILFPGEYPLEPICNHPADSVTMDPAIAPTCTESGLTEGKRCPVCNEILVAQEVVPALGHYFGEWIETTAPTCTEKGEETRYCSRCDATEKRDVDALGHDYAAAVTDPTCTEQGYTTHTCSRCGDTYTDTHTAALGHYFGEWIETTAPTCTEKGEEARYCSRCGATEKRDVYAICLRYDDRYNVSGKEVVIVDAGTPTSFKVGYGVGTGTPDDAVVRLEEGRLIACGVGTARIVIDGAQYKITVEAAPISLLFLIGQSNMQGSEGDKTQSIICPEGQVYSTYGERYTMTVDNARDFAPSALTGEYRDISVNGTTDLLSGYPVYSLTEPGEGKPGMDSGIAYEWVRATGEKVWVVNAAHGGTSINLWQKTGKEYKESLLLFSACRDTLSKEIAAGHFTLSHMCYFWCQGCNDSTVTAEWYVSKYKAMHENLKNDHAFDHDGDPSTPDVTFELGGIIPILYGLNSYREGVYKDALTVPYYESFRQLTFNGPRVAHYYMCADPELPDVYMVCNIGEKWVWMPNGTNGVKAYFEANYENGTVDYTPQVAQKASWYKPTTPAAVHDSIHYNQIGYNEVGLVTARNALILLGILPDTDEPTEVTFYNWTGYEEAESVVASAAVSPSSLIVPVVTPCYRSKQVTYTVSDGLEYKYYDITDAGLVPGTLTAVGAEGSVVVEPRSLASYTWICGSGGFADSPMEGDIENALIKTAGSFTDGQFKDTRYRVSSSVCLMHDQPWVVEIRVSDWTSDSGSMILGGASDPTTCLPYLYLRPSDGFAGFGCYNGTQYMNYGLSLAEHGISLKDGAHTFRFVNSVSEDGTNAVWLFADGVQIGTLDSLFVNSTFTSDGVNWFNGKDMIMNTLGATNFTLNGFKVEYIRVSETGKGGDIHVHLFTEWETVSLPSEEGTGVERRVCTLCGEAEERNVDGVWQIYDITSHLAAMPENVCCGTDLWKVLEHRSDYFASGVKWGVHSSGQVCSVTIPVIPGERIYATSFESGSKNDGHTGIRTTFFDRYGILKTYEPSQVNQEFVSNGGYIVAPEGAMYINIAMWTGSDEWEIYLPDREHDWGEWIQTAAPTTVSEGEETRRCARCGETETRTIPKKEIIDIILFAGQSNMCGRAQSTDAGFDTFTQTVTTDKAFTFNNASGSELLAVTEPISANGTNGYGMIPSFLNAYYDETGRRVCACFESHGGENIDKFTKYKLDPSTGEYTGTRNAFYTRMVTSVQNAKTSLESLGFEVGGVYMVWCQGENEAYYLGTAVGTYTTEYQSTLTADWQKIEYYIAHFNDMLECLKDDAGIEKAFIIRIGHRKNDTNKNSPIIKAQNIIGQTNDDAVVVTTFLAGATAYKRDDGTVVNLMRDAPHYLPEGYYLAGSEAGRNAGLYVNSGCTLKPVLYEYDVNAVSNAAEGEDPYIYDPYALD